MEKSELVFKFNEFTGKIKEFYGCNEACSEEMDMINPLRKYPPFVASVLAGVACFLW